MVLALFILAILAIVGISRYNEDDRLFWKLLASVTIAFAMTDIVYSAYNKYDSSTVDSPVQVQKATQSVSDMPTIDFANTNVKSAEADIPKVENNNVPAVGEITIPLSNPPHNARGQPNSCNCSQCPCKGITYIDIQDDS